MQEIDYFLKWLDAIEKKCRNENVKGIEKI